MGGGTMVHLAGILLHPRHMTVVEKDRLIVEMAYDYMMMRDAVKLDVRVADVHEALRQLKATNNRFELIVEDIFFKGLPAESVESLRTLVVSLKAVLAPAGGIVFNRRYGGHGEFDANVLRLSIVLSEFFTSVKRKRVVQRFRNELVFASGLKPSTQNAHS
jgi:spermidine synthase